MQNVASERLGRGAPEVSAECVCVCVCYRRVLLGVWMMLSLVHVWA